MDAEPTDEEIDKLAALSDSLSCTKVKCTGAFIGSFEGKHPFYDTPGGFPKIGNVYLVTKQTENAFMLAGVPSIHNSDKDTQEDSGWSKTSFAILGD